MTEQILSPSRTTAPGKKPRLINEFNGSVHWGDSHLSIAHRHYPGAWCEPDQTPEFDEFIIVLKGHLRVAYENGALEVQAGQAVIAFAGERVRYSTLHPYGAEYITVRLPAFSLQALDGDQQ
jgi:mannose-6-phosphate isomerase-like protein (cupin superfamily)